LGLSADEFVVVYVGRLVPWKRVDLLIDAWGQLDPRDRGRLIIVGDGSESDTLHALGSHVGPDVRFEGISRRPVLYLWAADAFANPSGDNKHQGEGLSVALLEAMAVGVPPVVTRGPGNDVVVEDGVTGLSFPVQDAAALAACLERVHHDVALRHRLGRDANARVRRDYSIETVAARLETLYASLIPDG
jgi:glycosyltransferase involved in cell wall biosynthesis